MTKDNVKTRTEELKEGLISMLLQDVIPHGLNKYNANFYECNRRTHAAFVAHQILKTCAKAGLKFVDKTAKMPEVEDPYTKALETRFKELKDSTFLTKAATFENFIKEVTTLGSPLNPIGSKGIETSWVTLSKAWKETVQDQCNLLERDGWEKAEEILI